MSRRKVIGSREILPDPKYGNLMLAKFINMVKVDDPKINYESKWATLTFEIREGK